MCVANAPLSSMLKILSDPIIIQTIGSSMQINKCKSALGFLVFYQFAFKSIQNKQNLTFYQILSTKSGNSTLSKMPQL